MVLVVGSEDMGPVRLWVWGGASTRPARRGSGGCDTRARIAPDHLCAELGEFLRHQRRTGVVRRDAAMLRREAEGDGNVELGERLHLPIEPVQRVGPEAVRPGEAG